MSANEDTLARLTFNATAMREYIGDDAKGVRLRVERGVVAFRPAKSLRGVGVDLVAIERRPRGTLAEVSRGQLFRRLMQGLFKAGLTEEQPYFVLGPAGRGWFGIEHISDQQAPLKQPLMVVTNFDPPPTPIDLPEWHRFMRLVSAGRTIPDETWKSVRQMIRSAEQLAARKGRRTQAREDGDKLLVGIERNAGKLIAWGERQPEVAEEIAALLERLGVEEEGAEVAEPPPEEPPDELAASDEQSEPPEVEPEPEVVRTPRRQRRKSRGFSPDMTQTEQAQPVEPPWIVSEVVETVVVEEVTEAETHQEAHQEAQQGEHGGPEGTDEAQGVALVGEVQGADETNQGDALAGDDDGWTDEAVVETADDQPAPPDEDTAARNELDEVILAAWERHETVEPDISTERLMMMVEDDTGADGPRQAEAMVRAGWPLPDALKNID